MLEGGEIRQGMEAFIKDPLGDETSYKKAVVLRKYPKPSRWLVVQYESGDMEHVEETQVTTMFDAYRKGIL